MIRRLSSEPRIERHRCDYGIRGSLPYARDGLDSSRYEVQYQAIRARDRRNIDVNGGKEPREMNLVSFDDPFRFGHKVAAPLTEALMPG